jgi:hypothetical protein
MRKKEMRKKEKKERKKISYHRIRLVGQMRNHAQRLSSHNSVGVLDGFEEHFLKWPGAVLGMRLNELREVLNTHKPWRLASMKKRPKVPQKKNKKKTKKK